MNTHEYVRMRTEPFRNKLASWDGGELGRPKTRQEIITGLEAKYVPHALDAAQFWRNELRQRLPAHAETDEQDLYNQPKLRSSRERWAQIFAEQVSKYAGFVEGEEVSDLCFGEESFQRLDDTFGWQLRIFGTETKTPQVKMVFKDGRQKDSGTHMPSLYSVGMARHFLRLLDLTVEGECRVIEEKEKPQQQLRLADKIR